MSQLFFSIITPAHNEEGYIENTLAHLQALAYPKEKFECIIIENGSSDRTFELAKRFEGGNVKVLQSAKGVSKAKNLGIDTLSKESDWVIFLDADTLLESGFLNELNSFLQKNPDRYTVGAFSVRPFPQTMYAKMWFWLYNLSRPVTKTSQSLKAVKRSLFPPIRFNESLVDAEDIDVIRKAQHSGEFFFLCTKSVSTSTRRFEKQGWWYVLLYWTFGAVVPARLRHRLSYKEIR